MEKRKFLQILASSSVGLGLIAILPKNFTKGLTHNEDNSNNIKNKQSETKVSVNLNPLAVKRNRKG